MWQHYVYTGFNFSRRWPDRRGRRIRTSIPWLENECAITVFKISKWSVKKTIWNKGSLTMFRKICFNKETILLLSVYRQKTRVRVRKSYNHEWNLNSVAMWQSRGIKCILHTIQVTTAVCGCTAIPTAAPRAQLIIASECSTVFRIPLITIIVRLWLIFILPAVKHNGENKTHRCVMLLFFFFFWIRYETRRLINLEIFYVNIDVCAPNRVVRLNDVLSVYIIT